MYTFGKEHLWQVNNITYSTNHSLDTDFYGCSSSSKFYWVEMQNEIIKQLTVKQLVWIGVDIYQIHTHSPCHILKDCIRACPTDTTHSLDRDVTHVLFLVPAVWVVQFLGIDELTTCQPELKKNKILLSQNCQFYVSSKPSVSWRGQTLSLPCSSWIHLTSDHLAFLYSNCRWHQSELHNFKEVNLEVTEP